MYELPNAELFFLDSKNNLTRKALHDMIKGKKVVIFGIPGAFTPTCSNSQVPDYEAAYDEIKSYGIDEIYCLSVNDPFVMKAWWKQLKIKKLQYLPDGNAAFSARLQEKSGNASNETLYVKKYNKGLGMRSWRYAMVVDDCIVMKTLAEELDPSKSRDNADSDPYLESTPESLIAYLKTRDQSERVASQKKNNVDLSAPQ